MEEILSSIKRIIAEEGESATASRAKRAGRPITPRSEPGAFGHDEILELSDPMHDPVRPAAEYLAPPAAAPTPSPAPAAAAPAPPAAAPAAPPADPILSPRAAEASRGALDALSRMVVRPEIAGSDTLEGMVREMLRPMLREWLDTNLPAMVETLVSREIARITGSR